MLRITSAVLTLVVVGCSNDSKPASNKPDGVQSGVNEREGTKAWDEFIARAKTRRKAAEREWQRKFESGELTIEFLRDDVKLDASRGTMVGEVQLKAEEYTVVSFKNRLPNGGFGKGSGKFSEYSLRFRYSGSSWQFADGTRKSADIHEKSSVSTSGVESLGESRYSHLDELFKR